MAKGSLRAITVSQKYALIGYLEECCKAGEEYDMPRYMLFDNSLQQAYNFPDIVREKSMLDLNLYDKHTTTHLGKFNKNIITYVDRYGTLNKTFHGYVYLFRVRCNDFIVIRMSYDYTDIKKGRSALNCPDIRFALKYIKYNIKTGDISTVKRRYNILSERLCSFEYFRNGRPADIIVSPGLKRIIVSHEINTNGNNTLGTFTRGIMGEDPRGEFSIITDLDKSQRIIMMTGNLCHRASPGMFDEFLSKNKVLYYNILNNKVRYAYFDLKTEKTHFFEEGYILSCLSPKIGSISPQNNIIHMSFYVGCYDYDAKANGLLILSASPISDTSSASEEKLSKYAIFLNNDIGTDAQKDFEQAFKGEGHTHSFDYSFVDRSIFVKVYTDNPQKKYAFYMHEDRTSSLIGAEAIASYNIQNMSSIIKYKQTPIGTINNNNNNSVNNNNNNNNNNNRANNTNGNKNNNSVNNNNNNNRANNTNGNKNNKRRVLKIDDDNDSKAIKIRKTSIGPNISSYIIESTNDTPLRQPIEKSPSVNIINID